MLTLTEPRSMGVSDKKDPSLGFMLLLNPGQKAERTFKTMIKVKALLSLNFWYRMKMMANQAYFLLFL